jgi:hypothetical protein
MGVSHDLLFAKKYALACLKSAWNWHGISLLSNRLGEGGP